MEYYHFFQQCKDYFETSSATKMNYTLFATSFLRGFINIKWAQYKRHLKVPFPSHSPTLKLFFKKTLKAHRFLLTVFEISLRRIHSIS